MIAVSATDLAIRLAKERGELTVTQHEGRHGTYWAISDSHGLIEVAMSEQEVAKRTS